MYDVTQALRVLDTGKHNVASKSGRSKGSSSKGSSSKGSKSSSHSSRRSGSSAADIKAEAAAKAAALQAKLKYFDEEVKQRAKLDKLRMMRDLEVEQAKVHAVCESLNGDSGAKGVNLNVNIPQRPTPPVVVSQVVGPKVVAYTSNTSESFKHQIPNPPNFVTDHTSIVPDTVQFDLVGSVPSTSKQSGLNSNAPAFYPRISQTNDIEAPTYQSIPSHELQLGQLVKQFGEFMNVSRLPIPEPGIFTGDPLEYPAWRSAFSTLIECHSIPPSQRVHYLKRYLGGNAKKSVEGYLLMPTDDSFQEAMKLIDSRFGDSFAVAFAFKSKIEQWPKIAGRDAEGLRNFSDFLKQCLVAARTNPSLRVLDDDTQNRVMLSKVPEWLVSRWARQVNKSREQTNMYPPFTEFVGFLSREADIACDPVTRLLAKVDNGKRVTQPHGSTLSTVQEQCTFCQNTNHHLEKCFKFRDKTAQEKEAFIKQKGICFGCLTPGHMSKACKKRLQCKTCGKHHPTILHNEAGVKASTELKPAEQVKNQNEASNGSKQACSSPASKHVSLMTNDAYVSKSTMVIPVYVSHHMYPETEILTYALLDNQSDTSFISDFVVSQLGVGGSETTLLLSTWWWW